MIDVERKAANVFEKNEQVSASTYQTKRQKSEKGSSGVETFISDNVAVGKDGMEDENTFAEES